jgi:signal peptidase
VKHRRWLTLTGMWMALGFAVGLVAAILLPRAFGARPLTVLSGSMEPAIATGDLVVSRRIAPLEAAPGDVVTFPDPTGNRRLITHRVKSIVPNGREVRFVTKGDANNASERWAVPADGRIGEVLYRLPKLGYLVFWISSPWGRILFLVIPALLLCCIELARIWRPRAGQPSKPAPLGSAEEGALS